MSPPAAATKEVPQQETPERRKARIDGIKKLIQQASSNVRPEAEQAAYRACALIRKHGLDVVDPSLLDSIYAENHRLKAELEAVKAGADTEDLFGSPTQFSGAHVVGHGAAPPNPGFWSTTQAGTWAPPASQAQSQPMNAPVFIAQSKFAGKCKHCGKVLNIGDPVQWIKKIGVWCGTTTCYSQWAGNQASAAGFNPNFGP